MAQGISGTIGQQNEDKKKQALNTRRATRDSMLSTVAIVNELDNSSIAQALDYLNKHMTEEAIKAFKRAQEVIGNPNSTDEEVADAATTAIEETAKITMNDPRNINKTPEEITQEAEEVFRRKFIEDRMKALMGADSDLSEAAAREQAEREVEQALETAKANVNAWQTMEANIRSEYEARNFNSQFNSINSDRMTQAFVSILRGEELNPSLFDMHSYYDDALEFVESEMEEATLTLQTIEDLENKISEARTKLRESQNTAQAAYDEAEANRTAAAEEALKLEQEIQYAIANPDFDFMPRTTHLGGIVTPIYSPEQEIAYRQEQYNEAQKAVEASEAALEQAHRELMASAESLSMLELELSTILPLKQSAEEQVEIAELQQYVIEHTMQYERALIEQIESGEVEINFDFIKKAVLNAPPEFVEKSERLKALTGNSDFDPFAALQAAAKDLPPAEQIRLNEFLEEVKALKIQAAKAEAGIDAAIDELNARAAMDPDGIMRPDDFGMGGGMMGRSGIISAIPTPEQELQYYMDQQDEAAQKLEELEAETPTEEDENTSRFLTPEERAETSGALTTNFGEAGNTPPEVINAPENNADNNTPGRTETVYTNDLYS